MSNFNTLESTTQEENLHSQFALQVAFQTMKERCQHFQARLAAVEEENIRLRLECGKEVAAIAEKSRKDTKDEISILKVSYFHLFSFNTLNMFFVCYF